MENAVVATDGAVNVPAQSQADVDADAALSAGFGAPPADAGATQDSAEGAGEVKEQSGEAKPATVPTTPEPAKAPVLIHGVPEEEWNAAVAKAAGPLVEAQKAEIRKNFGQIGELKKAIDALKGIIAAGGNTSRKKLTPEMLKRVNAELPGMGDAFAQDLAEFFDSPGVAADAAEAKAAAEAKGQTFDPDAFFNTKIGPALEQLEARTNERAELRIVKSIHRDFDQVMQSKEFSDWLGTLPEPERIRIRNSEEGVVAADAVTDFKAYRDAEAKKKQKGQARLAGAVPVNGDRQPREHLDQDEETQMAAGFKQVRGVSLRPG